MFRCCHVLEASTGVLVVEVVFGGLPVVSRLCPGSFAEFKTAVLLAVAIWVCRWSFWFPLAIQKAFRVAPCSEQTQLQPALRLARLAPSRKASSPAGRAFTEVSRGHTIEETGSPEFAWCTETPAHVNPTGILGCPFPMDIPLKVWFPSFPVDSTI